MIKKKKLFYSRFIFAINIINYQLTSYDNLSDPSDSLSDLADEIMNISLKPFLQISL